MPIPFLAKMHADPSAALQITGTILFPIRFILPGAAGKAVVCGNFFATHHVTAHKSCTLKRASSLKDVKVDTSVPSASSIEIEMLATDTAIIDQSNATERRLVTVKATYGAGDDVNDEYEYDIENLCKIT
jgi:hypothetical protein